MIGTTTIRIGTYATMRQCARDAAAGESTAILDFTNAIRKEMVAKGLDRDQLTEEAVKQHIKEARGEHVSYPSLILIESRPLFLKSRAWIKCRK